MKAKKPASSGVSISAESETKPVVLKRIVVDADADFDPVASGDIPSGDGGEEEIKDWLKEMAKKCGGDTSVGEKGTLVTPRLSNSRYNVYKTNKRKI